MPVYNQRDVILVKFPFTDITGFKLRPAIVVSNNVVNSTDDIIVVMLTTQSVPALYRVLVDNTFVDVPFKGVGTMNANCKKIAVLHKNIVQKKITRINDDAKFNEIINNIKSLFD